MKKIHKVDLKVPVNQNFKIFTHGEEDILSTMVLICKTNKLLCR